MGDKFKAQRFLRVSCSSFNNHPLQSSHFTWAAQKPLSHARNLPSIEMLCLLPCNNSPSYGYALKCCIVSSDLSTSPILEAPLVMKSQFSTRKLQAISASNLLSVFFLPGNLDEKKPHSFSKPFSYLIAFQEVVTQDICLVFASCSTV